MGKELPPSPHHQPDPQTLRHWSYVDSLLRNTEPLTTIDFHPWTLRPSLFLLMLILRSLHLFVYKDYMTRNKHVTKNTYKEGDTA